MNPKLLAVCVYVAITLISGIIGVLTESIAWGISVLAGGVLLFFIYEALAFRRWLKRPQQATSRLSPFWRKSGDSVAETLSNARSRTRSVLNELHQVRSVSDFIPDGWVILRESNGVELFNESAASLLGLTESDIGRNLSAIVRSPSFTRLLTNDDETEIVETSSPTNDNVRIELRLVVLENHRKLIVARDVTELNRLLSMRQDFIANVSHELRTPLTVLIGYIETMSENDLDVQTLNELVSRLVTPVNRMRSMVDDLLTLTTLESSPLPDPSVIHSLHMKSEIDRVLEEAVQLTTANHKFHVTVDDEIRIECVPTEIHSVIMNLVTNAIRYSPDGGEICIRCFEADSVGRFEIEDQGVGIPPELISRLTERFYRIDMKGSRARGGTGLGLAIVKHVLRRHGSELQVTSQLGKGSQFAFELPLILGEPNRSIGVQSPVNEVEPTI